MASLIQKTLQVGHHTAAYGGPEISLAYLVLQVVRGFVAGQAVGRKVLVLAALEVLDLIAFEAGKGMVVDQPEQEERRYRLRVLRPC